MTVPTPPPYTPNTPRFLSRSKSKPDLKRSKSRNFSTSSNDLPPPMPTKPGFFSLKSSPGTPNHNSTEISKLCANLIKQQKRVVASHLAIQKEEMTTASQLSRWGEQSEDESVKVVSGHLATLLTGIARQQDHLINGLETSRCFMKSVRNKERDTGKAREKVAKIDIELGKARLKGDLPRIESLEQAYEQHQVANSVDNIQLINVTRSKFKEAYAEQLSAIIEHAEKTAMLARHARRVLNLVDDTPLQIISENVPFTHEKEARTILQEAEDDLKRWTDNSIFSPTQQQGNFPAPQRTQSDTTAIQGMRALRPEMDVHPIMRSQTSTPASQASSFYSQSSSGDEYGLAHYGLASPSTSTEASWGCRSAMNPLGDTKVSGGISRVMSPALSEASYVGGTNYGNVNGGAAYGYQMSAAQSLRGRC